MAEVGVRVGGMMVGELEAGDPVGKPLGKLDGSEVALRTRVVAPGARTWSTHSMNMWQ